jgi:hypothetical protein
MVVVSCGKPEKPTEMINILASFLEYHIGISSQSIKAIVLL